MKIEKFGCAATVKCARKNLNYCVAAHPRSLEGTLTKYRHNQPSRFTSSNMRTAGKTDRYTGTTITIQPSKKSNWDMLREVQDAEDSQVLYLK